MAPQPWLVLAGEKKTITVFPTGDLRCRLRRIEEKKKRRCDRNLKVADSIGWVSSNGLQVCFGLAWFGLVCLFGLVSLVLFCLVWFEDMFQRHVFFFFETKNSVLHIWSNDPPRPAPNGGEE